LEEYFIFVNLLLFFCLLLDMRRDLSRKTKKSPQIKLELVFQVTGSDAESVASSTAASTASSTTRRKRKRKQ
jgi:hypothetical protein